MRSETAMCLGCCHITDARTLHGKMGRRLMHLVSRSLRLGDTERRAMKVNEGKGTK